MKDNGTARFPPPHKPQNYQGGERESAARPTERGVLQDHPPSTPVRACLPKSSTRSYPALVGPLHAQDFSPDSTARQRLAEKGAIVLNSIGRHVLSPEQSDPPFIGGADPSR